LPPGGAGSEAPDTVLCGGPCVDTRSFARGWRRDRDRAASAQRGGERLRAHHGARRRGGGESRVRCDTGGAHHGHRDRRRRAPRTVRLRGSGGVGERQGSGGEYRGESDSRSGGERTAVKHVLAMDQGTTGSTVLVFAEDGRVVGRGYREIPQHYPRAGWVE